MAISLTLGNFLKIDLYSSHTPEVRYTSIHPFTPKEGRNVQVSLRWVVEQLRGVDKIYKYIYIYIVGYHELNLLFIEVGQIHVHAVESFKIN